MYSVGLQQSVYVFGEGYSWHYVHGLELLEEKLAGVGNLQGRDVS